MYVQRIVYVNTFDHLLPYELIYTCEYFLGIYMVANLKLLGLDMFDIELFKCFATLIILLCLHAISILLMETFILCTTFLHAAYNSGYRRKFM